MNIKLEQPAGLENFYRDVAVIAYPTEEKLNSFQEAVAGFKINNVPVGKVLADGNPKSEIKIRKGDIIDIAFNKDFTGSKIVIFPYLPFTWDDMAKITAGFTIYSSTDGKVYKKISDQEFTGVNKSITASFPATKAKFFRVELIKSNCYIH